MRAIGRRYWRLLLGVALCVYLAGPQADTTWNVSDGVELDLTNPRVRLFSVDREPVYEDPSANDCTTGGRRFVVVPTPTPRPCGVIGSRLVISGFGKVGPFKP